MGDIPTFIHFHYAGRSSVSICEAGKQSRRFSWGTFRYSDGRDRQNAVYSKQLCTYNVTCISDILFE